MFCRGFLLLPVQHAEIFAAIIFASAAATDWLDGYLARRLNQSSKLGAFLDPVADKLMVAVVLVMLLQARPEIWLALPVAVIIGREITVSALREWMAEIGSRGKVAVSWLGKVKTALQMIALVLMILSNAAELPVWIGDYRDRIAVRRNVPDAVVNVRLFTPGVAGSTPRIRSARRSYLDSQEVPAKMAQRSPAVRVNLA